MTDKRVDWVGAALVTVGLILMMFAISDGETAPNGWATGCKSCPTKKAGQLEIGGKCTCCTRGQAICV